MVILVDNPHYGKPSLIPPPGPRRKISSKSEVNLSTRRSSSDRDVFEEARVTVLRRAVDRNRRTGGNRARMLADSHIPGGRRQERESDRVLVLTAGVRLDQEHSPQSRDQSPAMAPEVQEADTDE